MIVGVHDDAGYEGCADRALAGEVYRQFLPPQSAIPRAIDRSRAGAGKENIGIDRVDGQRPDRRQSPIGADALPSRPSVVAHEQTGIATRENGMRLCGMGDQRLYAAIERKRGAMPCPRLSGIRAVPYAPASRSKAYTVVRRHTLSPSSCSPRALQAGKIVLCLTLPQQMDLVLHAQASNRSRVNRRGCSAERNDRFFFRRDPPAHPDRPTREY